MTGRSSQLDAVGGDVGALCSWERRAGPNSCRGGTQKRVSLGLHPVSLRKSKEMGWNGQQGGKTSAQENGAHVKGANKVPPFLWLSACAPIRWEVVVAPCCLSTPFLWCLPKETVSSRQRKALFLPRRLHHPRERYRSVDGTFLARLGAGAGACRGGRLTDKRAPQLSCALCTQAQKNAPSGRTGLLSIKGRPWPSRTGR